VRVKTTLVIYSRMPARCRDGRWAEEFDVSPGAEAVAAALPGAVMAGVDGGLSEVLAVLDRHRPDVVFNLCEAPLGRPDREHHVAALLEWRGVPFTGSSSETLALCRNKERAKAVLAAAGIAVARAGGLPCVVKPREEDGSFGIDADSICDTPEQVDRALTRLTVPGMVEEFLPGREFAVCLWGRTTPDHVSVGETRFLNGMRLNTYASKWDTESAAFADTPLDYRTVIAPDLRASIIDGARAVWRAVGARSYLRVDVRQDAAGVPRVMDVNPNPALSPGIGVGRGAEEAGWTWEQLVRALAEWAC
jgi:D-alanine-D-alanine ligase